MEIHQIIFIKQKTLIWLECLHEIQSNIPFDLEKLKVKTLNSSSWKLKLWILQVESWTISIDSIPFKSFDYIGNQYNQIGG